MKRSTINKIALSLALFQLFTTSAKADTKNSKESNYSLQITSIFDEINLNTYQYGANQRVFSLKFDELINDPLILEEVQKYFPISDYNNEDEARFVHKKYFDIISDNGCGYAAATNFVFDLFKGHEKEFEEKFGFPMYKTNDGITDFNYELFMLKFFNYSNIEIRKITNNDDGVKLIKESFLKDFYEYQLDYYMKNNEVINLNKIDISKCSDKELDEIDKKEKERQEIIHDFNQKILNTKNNHVSFAIKATGVYGHLYEFLGQYGIYVNVSWHEDVDEYNVGDIIISKDYELYLCDKDGNITDGGKIKNHYVYVTDIVDDKIIVSSCGRRYIYNPNTATNPEKIVLKPSK